MPNNGSRKGQDSFSLDSTNNKPKPLYSQDFISKTKDKTDDYVDNIPPLYGQVFLKSLIESDEIDRQQNKINFIPTSLSLQDNAINFNINFTGLEKQFGEGYYGAQGIREHFKFKTLEEEKKFVTDFPRQEKTRKIKSTLNTPTLINSLEKGIYQGLEQNVELVTGLEGRKHELSIAELDDLRNSGYITTDEYTQYLKKRNALPFLTSLTAAVTNSMLIAFELPQTGVIKLTGAGAKFLSWKGLKYYGKEIVKQGVQSFKLFSTGATIRGIRGASEDIKKEKNPTAGDYIGLTAKHLFINWAEAFAEGASEGLLKNLRFGDVTFKELKRFDNAAWKTFGKNLLKKGGFGFFGESATEQTTDFLQDFLEGTKSNFTYIWRGETDEVRKQALENLLIEGLTGLILGHSLGMSEVFGSSIQEQIIDEVKKGTITEQQGEAVLDFIKQPDVNVKLRDELRKANAKLQTPDELKEAKAGIELFSKFGSRMDSKPLNMKVDEEIHNVAIKSVKDNLPTTLTNVDNQLTKMVMDYHIQPNILDGVFLLGKENTARYLMSLQEQDAEFNFLEDFIQNHPAYNISPHGINEITTRTLSRIGNRIIKISPDIIEELRVEESQLDSDKQAFLQQDLLAGIAMNFDDMSWQMLTNKWQGVIPQERLNAIVERAKTLTNPKLTKVGENALSEAFDDINEEIAAEISKRVSQELDAKMESANKPNPAIDEALPETDEGFYNQKTFDPESYRGDAERIAEVLGLRFEGFGQMGKHSLAYFTEPTSKSTRVVIVPEGLNVEEVRSRTQDLKSYDQKMMGPGLPANFEIFNPDTGEWVQYWVKRSPSFGIAQDKYMKDAQEISIEEYLEAKNKAYTMMVESFPIITSGIASNGIIRFEAGIDINSMLFGQEGHITYGELFTTFDGKTVNDLFNYLKGKELTDDGRMVDILQTIIKTIKNVPIVITDDLPENVAGRYIPEGYQGLSEQIKINKNIKARDNADPLRTLLHEAIHAWTVEYLKTKEGQILRGELQQIINQVRFVLSNPQQAIQQKIWMGDEQLLNDMMKEYNEGGMFAQDLNNYLKSPEELIAGVISDTTRLRAFMSNISVASMPNVEAQQTTQAQGAPRLTQEQADKIIEYKINRETEVYNKLLSDPKEIEEERQDWIRNNNAIEAADQLLSGLPVSPNLEGGQRMPTDQEVRDRLGRKLNNYIKRTTEFWNSMVGKTVEEQGPGAVIWTGEKNVSFETFFNLRPRSTQTSKPIESFEGKNRFLSNFYTTNSQLTIDGNNYGSVEAYYQWQKLFYAPNTPKNDLIRADMELADQNPAKTKQLAKQIEKLDVAKWNADRLNIMEKGLRAKFDQNPNLKQQLIDTGNAQLIEGNWWGDTFWGVSKGRGENNLGKLLMKLRSEYQENAGPTRQETTTSKLFDLWSWVKQRLTNVWQALKFKNTQGNAANYLWDLLQTYEQDLQLFNYNIRRNRNYTPRVIKDLRDASLETTTTGLKEIDENLQKAEYEDNDIEENDEDTEDYKFGTNFVDLAAEIDEMDNSSFRSMIGSMPTVNHFFIKIDELDQKSNGVISAKIDDLWNNGGFKDKVGTKEDFEIRFLTGLYTFLKSSKVMPFVSLRTDKVYKTSQFSIVEQPQVFTMGDGATRSSYVRPIVLERFIPELERVFDLEPGDLQMSYVAGFEVYRDNKFESRNSITKISHYHIGANEEQGSLTEVLAHKIYLASSDKNRTYIYLGNFGGNNTLPLLSVPKGKLAQFKTKANQLLQSLNTTKHTVNISQYSQGAQLTMAARLALKDISLNKIPQNGEFAENSAFRTMEFGDLNRLWKRDKSFITPEQYIATDATTLERIIGRNTFSGISVTGGEHKDVILNAAVFNSNDDGMLEVHKGFTSKNEPIIEQIPISSVLVNDYNTEKTDGVIFYLLNEFDKIYHNVHGTIKDGVIKNVYASKGGDPLYLKHSMQGVSRSSALGQYMIKNNLALLVSDTSRKVPLRDNERLISLSETADPNKVLKLNLKDFARIGEKLYTDPVGGTVKQWLNSSGLTKGNPLLNKISMADAYHKAVSNFINSSSTIAMNKVQEMSTKEGLLKILRGIVNNPQSPRERAISKNLRRPLQLEDADFLKQYGGILNHPTIAKQIRQRLFKPLDAAIQGRIGGIRAVLRPDVGWANAPANVDPVNNPYSIDMLLISQPVNSTLSKKAFPEKGLHTLAQRYVELQRMESRMLTKHTQDQLGFNIHNDDGTVSEVKQKKWIDYAKSKTIQQIKELAQTTDDIDRKADLSSGDIRRAINKRDKAVKDWRDNIVFGKESVDSKGKLNRSGGILKDVSGSLHEDWVVISDDIAKRFGLKPGDRLIAVITPTDSPLGIISVRVGGIASAYGDNRVTDRSSVVFNSEYIQSIVGKDYDIDEISLIPFDPDYWQPEDYDAVWGTLKELKGQYKSWLAKEASQTLGSQVTEDTVFTKEIYPDFMEKYIVDKLGDEDTGRLAGVDKFNALDHFFAVDSAYLVDPNKAIVRRQFHTMLSAIDFKAGNFKVNLDKNKWLTAHLLHLIDTNFSVDFPNKTSRLKYNPPNSDKLLSRFSSQEWGLNNIKYEVEGVSTHEQRAKEVREIQRFFRWLFGDALNLARGSNALTGESLDYYSFKTLLQRQQKLLRMLKSANIEELIDLYIQDNPKVDRSLFYYAFVNFIPTSNKVIIDNKVFLSDIADYPLFQMIMSIDPNKLSMPGSSHEDWLIDQVVTTKQVLQSSTALDWAFKKWVMDDPVKQKKYFSSPREGVQYDAVTRWAIALSEFPKELDFRRFRKNQPNSLDAIRNEVLTIVQGMDEVALKRDKNLSDVEKEQDLSFRKGRAAAYPMLFEELLKKKRVQFKNLKQLNFTHKGTTYQLNTIKGQVALRKGENGNWYKAEAVLKAETDDTKELKRLFTQQNGVWESTENRLEFSNNLGFVANIPVDDRINLAKKLLAQRLYGPNEFMKMDVQAFWLSLLAQVSEEGRKDNKAPGLITANYAFDPDKPMDFQANDAAMELFAQMEPTLFNQWIRVYSAINQNIDRQQSDIGVQRLAEDSEGANEIFNQTRFDETDGPATARESFQLLIDDILKNQTDMSIREFRRAIEKGGYKAGLNIVKGMIKNDPILEALAQSDIYFGDLLYDIKNLSAAAFEKKYEYKDADMVNAVASRTLGNDEYVHNFLTQEFGTQNYDSYEDIPTLLQIFSVLKTAQKSKYKADKELNPIARKLGVNYLSYKFLAPIKEAKTRSTDLRTTVVDNKFTVNGTQHLSLQDVDLHMRIYPTRTYQAHGESSIAIAKNQEMNRALNYFQAEMSTLVKDADELTEYITDKKARETFLKESPTALEPEGAGWIRKNLEASELSEDEKWDSKRRIFELAEDMRKKQEIQIIHAFGKVVSYKDLKTGWSTGNKYQFIDTLFPTMNPHQKLEMLAALNYRELYDVKVADIISKAMDYLRAAQFAISKASSYDTILELQALIDRYTQYELAINTRAGDYMPHMYPIAQYKMYWYTEYKNLVQQKLSAQIKQAQRRASRGQTHDAELASIDLNTEEGQRIFKAKTQKYLDHEWETFRVGNPSSYIIPNFLARRIPDTVDLKYLKGTSEMHYNYINNLIQGLRNDLMYADWLTYQYKARRSGERSNMIELTRMWYADQIQNKMLHTKSITVKNLKPGMQINFLHDAYNMDVDDMTPTRAGVQVWGIVDKVDLKENKLHLKVDREKIKFRASQAIMSLNSIIENLSTEDLEAKATLKQVLQIKNQLQRGYLKPKQLDKSIEDLNVRDAALSIIKGYQYALDHIDEIGIYDLSEIYTRNLRGYKDKEHVNRYMRRGAIERLDGKAMEVKNLKGDDGTFEDKMDAISYGTLKASAWTAGATANLIKQSQAMTFLGMVVAPKAFVYNFLGATTANLIDAPVSHLKMTRDSMKEWGTIKHLSPTKMNPEQLKWYNTMVALGLASNKDLVAISLQAGNIDPVDILSNQGKFDTVRYLAKGIIEGAPYEAHLKRLDELRTKYIQSDLSPEVELEIIQEESLWRAKVDGIINKRISKLTPEERKQAFSKVSQLEAEGKPRKTSFVEETNLTRTQALKQAAKLLKNSILRGNIGLGLQAKAEVLRRPGFYIGYQTALENGFNKEQAIQMGINSIELRHAFYSPGYKQFGSNTKLGSLMFQFSQYSWNAFEKQYRMWKEAIPQTYKHWTAARLEGQNIFEAFWNTVIKRTTPMVDAMGRRMRNSKGMNISEVNLAHYLFMRWTLGSMLMQAGTRAFYGITNWQDPMVQLIYKISDMLTDIPKGDLDPDELAEFAWLMTDALFFVGVPYKLAMQVLFKENNKDVGETLVRGRVEDQIDFAFRVNNEIAVLRNGWLRQSKEYNRNLEQVSWWFDDFFAGVKFFGYSAPDKSGQPYQRWGYYPGLNSEFPFFTVNKELKTINPINSLRYYNTNRRGIGGEGRELQRLFELGFSPQTWIPFLDKAFYPHKSQR